LSPYVSSGSFFNWSMSFSGTMKDYSTDDDNDNVHAMVTKTKMTTYWG